MSDLYRLYLVQISILLKIPVFLDPSSPFHLSTPPPVVSPTFETEGKVVGTSFVSVQK